MLPTHVQTTWPLTPGRTSCPDYAVKYYIDTLAADPDHLRGSFELYRAFPAMIAQNEQRKTGG